MAMNHLRVSSALCAALFLVACHQTPDDKAQTTQTDVQQVTSATANADTTKETQQEMLHMSDQLQTINGRIEYKTFEGGFYAFIAEDGSHYTLMSIDKRFLRHGLRLTIEGVPKPDMLTTTQFGTVFEVTTVSNVDETGVRPKPTPAGDS